MMKKQLSCLLLCLMLFPPGCGSETSAPAEETVAPVPADILEGSWTAKGVIYGDQYIPLTSSEALADLYDTNWVTIQGDGTFYIQNNAFTYKGTWTRQEVEGYENIYLFSQTTSIRYTMSGGELEAVEQDYEKEYVAFTAENDTDTLVLCEQGASDSIVLVYGRDGQHSQGSSISTFPATRDTSGSQSTATATMGEKNALQTAKSYLNVMAFSYEGLIDQLEFEGYTHSEAVYGADHCGADWYEQAAKKAAEYLDVMSFSRQGLIDQLEFEGFTHDQAVYGVEANGY